MSQEKERIDEAEKLTQEEKRVLIAQARGYKEFPFRFNNEQKVWALNQEQADSLTLGVFTWSLTPDYFRDLKACHEMEESLNEGQREVFADNIIQMFPSDKTNGFSWIHATASQRAEAFGLTLGLWEEGQ